MSQPLDTTLIEARIRDVVSQFEVVGGAADYAAVQDLRGFRTPSAFVVACQEKRVPEASEGQRRISGKQQVETTFGVVLALRNYRDPRGEAVNTDARPLIGAVRDALMGWTPGAGIMRPIAWQQGDVLDYDANTLLWAEVFSTKHFIGGNAP